VDGGEGERGDLLAILAEHAVDLAAEVFEHRSRGQVVDDGQDRIDRVGDLLSLLLLAFRLGLLDLAVLVVDQLRFERRDILHGLPAIDELQEATSDVAAFDMGGDTFAEQGEEEVDQRSVVAAEHRIARVEVLAEQGGGVDGGDRTHLGGRSSLDVADPLLREGHDSLRAAEADGERQFLAVERLDDVVDRLAVSASEPEDRLMPITHRDQPTTSLQELLGQRKARGVDILALVHEHPVILPHVQVEAEGGVDHVLVVQDLGEDHDAIVDGVHGPVAAVLHELVDVGGEIAVLVREFVAEVEPLHQIHPRFLPSERELGEDASTPLPCQIIGLLHEAAQVDRHADDAVFLAGVAMTIGADAATEGAFVQDAVDLLGRLRLGGIARCATRLHPLHERTATEAVSGPHMDAGFALGGDGVDLLLDLVGDALGVGAERDVTGHEFQRLDQGGGLAATRHSLDECVAVARDDPVEDGLLHRRRDEGLLLREVDNHGALAVVRSVGFGGYHTQPLNHMNRPPVKGYIPVLKGFWDGFRGWLRGYFGGLDPHGGSPDHFLNIRPEDTMVWPHGIPGSGYNLE